MNFELQLKEEKVRPHQVTALHLIAALLFTGAGALLVLFQPSLKPWWIALVVSGIILLLVTVTRNKWLLRTNNNRIVRIAEFLVLLSLTIFFALHKWTPPAVMAGAMAAAVLFALFWENNARKLAIHIDESGVKLPFGKMKRDIRWEDIEQVILKYGTLTVNCIDNRLYQWSVISANVDVSAFSSFCDQQVEQGRLNKDKNDW